MNDTELHSRLTALAHALAPDADPYAQIADARGLHRHRQRTRLGVAGAAVAVALVAVGVPTAVSTLSSSPDGDAARPSLSSDALRGAADAVRARMAWPDDGSIPDPDRGRSCSGSAEIVEVVEVDSRYRPVLEPGPGGSTDTVCMWSTDWTGNVAAETRVDLELSTVDLDADRLLDQLEEDGGCPWTTLFPERSFTALRVCEVPVQRRWELFVLDDDGTGGWVMTAAVGQDLPAGSTVAAGSVAALWGVVVELDAQQEPPSPGDVPEITPMNQEVIDLVDELTGRSGLVLESGGGWSCAGATAQLEGALGLDLTEGPVDVSLPPQPVCWWTVGPTPTSETEAAATVALTIAFVPGVDDRPAEQALEPGLPGAGGPQRDEDYCLTFEVGDEASSPTVDACEQGARTRYAVIVPDRAGGGLWTLTVSVPEGIADISPSTAALALVDAADRIW